MRYRLKADWRDEGVREVCRLTLPRILGLGAAQLNLIITIFFASRLGDQTISALNYAWTLAVLPLGLFGMAISTAVFPTLAEQAARKSLDVLRRTITTSLRLILFFTLPASVGLILLREPLVALLLERGAFSEDSTELTASALALYSVGLFAHAAIEILSRGFYAVGDTRTPVTMAVLSMILTLVFSLVLVGPLEHDGLALAFSLAAIVEAYLLYANLGRRFGGFDNQDIVSFLYKVFVAAILMTEVVALFVFGFAAMDLFGDRSFWANLIVVTFASSLGAAAFVATALLLRCEEAQLVVQQLGAKSGLGLRPRS
jgi:putative peptidoglycan lipid II flippase